MTRRIRAYVGLGSNVGDSRAELREAVQALGGLPGVSVRAVSPVYRTKPVGVTDQPEFLNAVAAVDVTTDGDADGAALELLAQLKRLERSLGRQKRGRWGPREIDLDVLVFGRHEINATRPDGLWLKVPHPAARDRLFVLAPLADLAPRLRPPGWGETVTSARLRRQRVDAEDAITPAGRLA